MSALSDLLNSKKPEDWSGRRVGRELRARGVEISDATVALYLSGDHSPVPAEDTLRGFNELWSIPLQELRSAAGVPMGEEEPWAPPAEANRLNRRQRNAMAELIRSLVESTQESGVHAGPAVEKNGNVRAIGGRRSSAQAPPRKAAARKGPRAVSQQAESQAGAGEESQDPEPSTRE